MGTGGPASIASRDRVPSSEAAAVAAAATRSRPAWPAVAAGGLDFHRHLHRERCRRRRPYARNAGGAAAFDAEGRRTLGGGVGRAAGLVESRPPPPRRCCGRQRSERGRPEATPPRGARDATRGIGDGHASAPDAVGTCTAAEDVRCDGGGRDGCGAAAAAAAGGGGGGRSPAGTRLPAPPPRSPPPPPPPHARRLRGGLRSVHARHLAGRADGGVSTPDVHERVRRTIPGRVDEQHVGLPVARRID